MINRTEDLETILDHNNIHLAAVVLHSNSQHKVDYLLFIYFITLSLRPIHFSICVKLLKNRRALVEATTTLMTTHSNLSMIYDMNEPCSCSIHPQPDGGQTGVGTKAETEQVMIAEDHLE